jgi:hypothetical protein
MRLIMSPLFTSAHAAACLVALLAIGPFVAWAMSDKSRHNRRAVYIGIAIVALVALGLSAGIEAAPYDPCGSCGAVWPAWWCELWWGC